MGQRLLRISTLFPKLPKNHAECHLGIESLPLAAEFAKHDSECRVLTTIVLPTYSVLQGMITVTMPCADSFRLIVVRFPELSPTEVSHAAMGRLLKLITRTPVD